MHSFGLGTRDDAGYTFSKAAQILGVTEKQLVNIIKTGIVHENEQGLIDGDSMTRWKQQKQDAEDLYYRDKVEVLQNSDWRGRANRNQAHEEAIKHFEKEIQKWENEKWEELMKPAEKEREKARAEAEVAYKLRLKEIGLVE